MVARAYVDQLTRSKGIEPGRAGAVTGALAIVDRLHSGRDKGAADAQKQLESLATALEGDAAGASGRDAQRLRALASTLKGRAAGLR